MHLKPNTDIKRFMNAVQSCREDVFFVTGERDQLNLRSTLSQFLFIMVAGKKELLKNGEILFRNPEDAAALGDFLISRD